MCVCECVWVHVCVCFKLKKRGGVIFVHCLLSGVYRLFMDKYLVTPFGLRERERERERERKRDNFHTVTCVYSERSVCVQM